MDNNRKQTLEDIRRQSLEKWSEAQRRALNEATKNTPVNDRNAAGSGTGSVAGGSFSTFGEFNIGFFNLYTEPASNYEWKMSKYDIASDQWSSPSSLGLTENESNNKNWYLTTGYGTFIDFNKVTGAERRHIYVDNNCQVLYDTGYISFSNYDIDSYNEIGLIATFNEYTINDFEVITYYKDIKNTFTFDDNYTGTSFNLQGSIYNDKIVYIYGENSSVRTAYALDLVTGGKNELFTIPAYNFYSTYYFESNLDSGNPNLSASIGSLFYYTYSTLDNYNVTDCKIVDYNGNVIVDIVAQCSDIGLDLTQTEISDYWIFGSFYNDGNPDRTGVMIVTEDGYLIIANAVQGVYFAGPRPSFMSDSYYILPGYTAAGNASIIADLPISYTNHGDLLSSDNPSTDKPSFYIIAASGDIFQHFFDGAVQLTNDVFIDSVGRLVFWQVLDGSLMLNKINTITGALTEDNITTSIFDINTSSFYTHPGYTPDRKWEQLLECYQAGGDVTTYYLQDTFLPTVIHDGPGGGYAIYTNSDIGEKRPLMYIDTTVSPRELFIVDRTTRLANEYELIPGLEYSFYEGNYSFSNNQDTRIAYNGTDWVYIREGFAPVTGTIPTGESLYDMACGDNYIIIVTDVNLHYYTLDGQLFASTEKGSDYIYPYNDTTITYDNIGSVYIFFATKGSIKNPQQPVSSNNMTWFFNDNFYD